MELFVASFWILCGAGAAMIANSKGRNGPAWFFAGILFGPLTLLIVGFMAPAIPYGATQQAHYQTLGYKKCPNCAESILAGAKVCRYCGRDLLGAPVQSSPGLIAPIANYRTCLNCKEGNPRSVTFCIHCGAKMNAGNTQVTKALNCPTCGEANMLGSLYCFNCQSNMQQISNNSSPHVANRGLAR